MIFSFMVWGIVLGVVLAVIFQGNFILSRYFIEHKAYDCTSCF